MKRFALAAAVFTMLSASNFSQAGPVGFDILFTTHYGFGSPPGNMGAFGGSPDTGYIVMSNIGTTTFTGTISDVALANGVFGPGGPDDSQMFPGVTLGPGASFTFTVASESSNVGGFNGPPGAVQPGILFKMIGLMDGMEAVDLEVHDADIHSGVVNAGGQGSDAYVAQGGSPTGADYGDAVEVAQAPGVFEFKEVVAGTVPEPASLTLLGIGIVGMAGYGWRRKK